MITPIIIQVLFWLGILVAVIAALVSMFTQSFFVGLLMLILGPILVWVYCELLIVIFKIHDCLEGIREAQAPPQVQEG
ncbi:MAG TPA: hypothetical protein VMY37_31370 [Thermoguttaceae bacterium]|nr:hypothetical protein [Thermoguttaceae bacterium]